VKYSSVRFVFLHGIGNNASTWDTTLGQAAWQGHQCTALTAPGFGGTTWNGWKLEAYAGSVRERIAEVSEPTVLVGHSVGGIIGTLVAEQAPDNMIGFVNVEGNLTEFDSTYSRLASETNDIDAWLTTFINGNLPGQNFALPEQAKEAIQQAEPAAYRSWAVDTVRLSPTMLERYKGLGIPTLYVYGEGMDARTVSGIETFAEIDNHSVVQVLRAGHWVMHDKPELFSTIMTEWAQQYDRPYVAGLAEPDDDSFGLND
jgi:pimeloyl-ACP methyl ester carboxylesterase